MLSCPQDALSIAQENCAPKYPALNMAALLGCRAVCPVLADLLGKVSVTITCQSTPQVLGNSAGSVGSVLSAGLEVSVTQAQGKEMGFQKIRNEEGKQMHSLS